MKENNTNKSLVATATNESAQVVVLDNLFNPSLIQTLNDAEYMIDTSLAMQNRMNLASYKAVALVHDKKLWENQSYIDEKGKQKMYTSFEDWCKRAYNIGKTSVYDYLKVADFITADGRNSTIPHEENNDFTFTHLVSFINNKLLYDVHELVSEKGKIMKVKSLKRMPKVERCMINGVPAYGAKGEKLYQYVEGEETDVLTYLAVKGIISPEYSVKQCNENIKRELGVTEVEDVTDIETPVEEVETPVEEVETPVEEVAEENIENYIKQLYSVQIDLNGYLNENDINADIILDITEHFKAIINKLHEVEECTL